MSDIRKKRITNRNWHGDIAITFRCPIKNKQLSKRFLYSVTYIRVTRNSNKIPILNSNNTVVYLTQVNEGNSISFIYTIGFYRCVISLLMT